MVLKWVYYFLADRIHQFVNRRLAPVHPINAVSQSIQPAVLEMKEQRRDTVVY
jgi:hypothetical protein